MQNEFNKLINTFALFVRNKIISYKIKKLYFELFLYCYLKCKKKFKIFIKYKNFKNVLIFIY